MKTKKPQFRFKSVLLIDDNELDNFINQKMMEAHHFAERIYTATNGKSAIDFIKNLLLMQKSAFPEIIFIDLNMPLMDGFQFIEFCRSEPAMSKLEAKLVVLTSSVNEQDRVKIERYKAGIRFLNKPLSTNMLASLD